MSSSEKRQVDLVWLALGGSLLLSLYTYFVPESYNDDAYLYIRTAELFRDNGLTAALAHYSWPAYSILIGALGWLGLELFAAAFLLNALLFVLLTYALFEIVRFADDSIETQWAALLCILLYPELNEYRYLIVRDIGFWAFSFFGLLCMLRYGKRGDDRQLLLFCLAMLSAALFRLEAMAYLLLTPLGMLALSRGSSLSPAADYRRAVAAAAASLAMVALLLLLAGFSLLSLVGDFLVSYRPFIDSVLADDPTAQDNLARAVFGDYAATFSDDFLYLFIGAGLTAVLAASVVKGIGIPLLITLGYGLRRQREAMVFNKLQPLWVMAVVNLIIVWFFLVITRYLPSRYAMVACIALVLLVPLVLGALLRKIDLHRHSMARVWLLLLLMYTAIDSYFSLGKSDDFIRESVSWLNEGSRNEQALLTNNREIAYRSGRVIDYDRPYRFIEEKLLLDSSPGTYLAIERHPRLDGMLEKLVAERAIGLEREFAGEAGSVAIYRRLPD